MDADEVRRRVVWRAAWSPGVVLPAVVGVLTVAAGALAGAGVAVAAGAALVLAGIGVAGWRVTRGAGALAADVLDDQRDAEVEAGAARLKAVERRLEKTRDVRTFRDIRSMRALRRRVLGAIETGAFEVPPQVAGMSEELFESCVESLERSAVLWETARKMATAAAREELMARREGLLVEVSRSVEQWARTVDALEAAPLQREGTAAELVRVRDELETNLQVARRVEARLQALERELGGGRGVGVRE